MTERHAPYDILQWLSLEAGAAMIASARLRRVRAGGTIYAQSDMGDEMFRLVSGSVRLSVMAANGRELVYQRFGPGDCFGTSSLVDGEPRPQTAQAYDPVELQVFDRTIITQLRGAFPDMNDALLKLLSRHMRLLSDYFAGATLDEVFFRVAQRLVDAAEAFGVRGEHGIALSRRLSQSELALMVGTTRQTVNKMLQQFQDKGLIAIRSGAITITDLPNLRKAAGKGSRLREFAA